MGEGGLEFAEEGGCRVQSAGPAKFFEFVGELRNAFGAEIEAHAFERVSMEGKLVGVLQGIGEQVDMLGRASEEKVDKLAEHGQAVMGRKLAEFANERLVQERFTAKNLGARQERGVRYARLLQRACRVRRRGAPGCNRESVLRGYGS